jgi:putative phosphotransacetylase
LSRTDCDTLFGAGYALTKKKTLMGGQYAAEETLTLTGKKGTLEGVRVLGPLRAASQAEVSRTDSFKLGVIAPVRESGDTGGSAPVALVGPKGAVYLKEGLIVAKRHVHMSPADAAGGGYQSGDVVSVRFGTERGGTLDGVTVRVDKTYTLEMHIDTDEANALGVVTGDTGSICPKE